MKVFLFSIFLTSFQLLSSEWEPISKERAAELVIKKSKNFLDYKNGDVIKFRITTNFGEGCVWTFEESNTILLDYKVFRQSYVWKESKWGYSGGISNASYCKERYGDGNWSDKRLHLKTHRNLEVDFIKEILEGKLGDDYEYNSELNKIRFFAPLTKELGIKSIFNLSGNDQTFFERMVRIKNTPEGKELITSQAWKEKSALDIKKLYSELNDEKVYIELYYFKGLEPKTFPLDSNTDYDLVNPNETFGKILSSSKIAMSVIF